MEANGTELNVDVIIIGGGPSGLTVAGEVATAGHSVVVLETRTNVVASRAGTFMPRVLELFDARGIADRFVRKAAKIHKWPFMPHHIWAGLQPIHWKNIDTRFPFTLMMPQNDTEEVLMEWAIEKGAKVLMGHEVTSFNVDNHGVSVVAKDTSGKEHRITGRYLVGADGAHSSVRKGLGIPFEGRDPTFLGFLVDVVLDFPFEGVVKMVDNQKGWSACYPFGDRIVRFLVVHHERRNAGRHEPVTLEELKACLRDIHGTDFGIKEMVWGSRYGDSLRIVPNLRHGRAFLVGESSRIHYPASGVGMNFCIMDAFNLGWKLSYVLSGNAPAELLNTYNEERRPVNLELLHWVRAQLAVQFNFTDDGFALKRELDQHIIPIPGVNRYLGLVLSGIVSPYPRSPDAHPTVGFRAKDIDLILIDGTLTRLSELLRDQKFLLLDLSGKGAFKSIGFHHDSLKVVEAMGVKLPEMEEKVQALLVRPDAYVAWATNDVPHAADALVAFKQSLCMEKSVA